MRVYTNPVGPHRLTSGEVDMRIAPGQCRSQG